MAAFRWPRNLGAAAAATGSVLRDPRQRRRVGAALPRAPDGDPARPSGRSTSSPATPGSSGGPLDGQPARPWPDLAARPSSGRCWTTKRPFSSCRSSGAGSTRRSAASTSRCRTNEDYDFWIRAALAGTDSGATISRSATTAAATTACRLVELRMLRGIIRVLREDTARCFPGSRPSSQSSTRQLARFETERLAAEARASIEAGDFRGAGDHLQALHQQAWRRRAPRGRTHGAMDPPSAVDRLQHPPERLASGSVGATGADRHEVLESSSRPTTGPADLRQTLRAWRGCGPMGRGKSSSSTTTRQTTTRACRRSRRHRRFPVELRYLFEREQGRSPALNTGIRAARGEIIATTDDDVRVPADWLNRAARGPGAR